MIDVLGCASHLETFSTLKVRKGSFGSWSKVAINFSADVAQIVETPLKSRRHRDRVEMSQEPLERVLIITDEELRSLTAQGRAGREGAFRVSRQLLSGLAYDEPTSLVLEWTGQDIGEDQPELPEALHYDVVNAAGLELRGWAGHGLTRGQDCWVRTLFQRCVVGMIPNLLRLGGEMSSDTGGGVYSPKELTFGGRRSTSGSAE